MKRSLQIPVLAAAAALLGATATLAHRRQLQQEASPRPLTDNPGPRGIAALHAWLLESGRGPLRLESPGDHLPPAATLVLAAPAAALDRSDVAALMAHAEGGALVVWAAGPQGSQPELERRLALSRIATGDSSARPGEPELPVAPHPLFAGLSLRSAGGAVESRLPAALAVAGHRDLESDRLRAAALSIPIGRGEVLILAGTSLLENFRIAEEDNLSLWARIAARGRLALDERFREPRSGPPPPSARALGLLAGQALAAAICLVWGLGRRLGPVRPPPPAHQSRTAADYLSSLAILYRRARAEPQLCRAAWDRFRHRLARRGIPLRLGGEEAARRLARASPAAAGAFRRAHALSGRTGNAGPREMYALSKAIAEVEASLGTGARFPPRGDGDP